MRARLHIVVLLVLGFGLLWSCAAESGQPPAEEKATKPTPHPKKMMAKKAAAKADQAAPLFAKYCERCHGRDGKGNGSKSLSAALPDFTSPAWQQGISDPQLAVSILEGKGTRMPAFAEKMSESQAQQLAAYVRSLGPEKAAPATAPPTADDEFQKQFRELLEELMELQKQFKKLTQTPPKK